MTLTINLEHPADLAPRSVKTALWRGLNCTCPACGKGPIFTSYMKVVDRCQACGEDLSHQQADDAPPYFTIVIIGHIIVPLVLIVEKLWHPSLPVHFALWLTVTIALTLWIMPRVKGAVVGFQWANRMHGFGPAIGTDAT